MDLLMTGRRMDVEEAKKYGLVNRACPVKTLKKQAIEWAHQIAQSAPLSLAAIKSVIKQTEGMDLESAFDYMRSGKVDDYSRMLESEDAKEGPLAFSENRAPKWNGK
jgi:crotonobetainyl-CoA hydratase